MTPQIPFVPDGYVPVRILAERNGSWVCLARNPSGDPCCLKVQQLAQPAELESLCATRALLRGLPADHAWITLGNMGADRAASVVWEEMDLADDAVTGLPFRPELAETYTPLTLAGHVRENGPSETTVVLEWGIGLARALVDLHRLGLFHRDIKPANILVHRGRCVLGDYGSVGAAGSSVEFPGTEGYVPPDGMGSPGLDVFALGRTLYESWTGLDRFQFPSLPACILEAADWHTHGWQFNRVLGQASDRRPSHRIPTAGKLLEALEGARRPRRQVSRRRAIGGVAGILAAGTAGYIWKSLSPYRAVWTKLPPARFGYEGFHPAEFSCDWSRRTLYSIFSDTRAAVVQAVDLSDWSHRQWSFPPTKNPIGSGVFLPDRNELWSGEIVSGRVHRFDAGEKILRNWGDSDLDLPGFTGATYWNSVTRSLGQFAGYGNFKCHSRRREFRAEDRSWRLVPEQSSALPYPRGHPPVLSFPGLRDGTWCFQGGFGNPSGVQHERFPFLKDYDGNFYPLNDLWEVDLARNQWRELLGPQAWMPTALKAATCHRGTQTILFLCGSEGGRPREAHFSFVRGTPGELPRRIPNAGDRIELFRFWSLLVDPENQHLLVFADEGIFDVALEQV